MRTNLLGSRLLGPVRRLSSTPQRPRNKTLLLVWHSRTGLAEQMAAACERGAHDAAREMEEDGFVVKRRRAADATVDDLLGADGYLFCAPENLASTSGEVCAALDACCCT